MAIKNWEEAEAEAIRQNLAHPVRAEIINAVANQARLTRYQQNMTFWDASMADAIWEAIKHHFETEVSEPANGDEQAGQARQA